MPEAITFGADEDEALLQAVDALESALSFYVDARQPLPMASKPKRGQRTARPSALEVANIGVYLAMTEQGIRKSELARRRAGTCRRLIGCSTCDMPRGWTRSKPLRARSEGASKCASPEAICNWTVRSVVPPNTQQKWQLLVAVLVGRLKRAG